MTESGEPRDVLIEATRIGDLLRLCALDPATGVEVVVAGPATARAALEAVAVNKLRRRLGRGERKAAASPRRPQRGELV